MVWYPIIGYLVFWIGLITAIILYVTLKKWHPIMYLISVSLYVFTISFIIDVFDVSKNGIMLIFSFSAVLMIAIGYYISNKLKK